MALSNDDQLGILETDLEVYSERGDLLKSYAVRSVYRLGRMMFFVTEDDQIISTKNAVELTMSETTDSDPLYSVPPRHIKYTMTLADY